MALGLVLVVFTKHPDPMAGQTLDSDKPVCLTSCRELKPTKKFSTFFGGFVPKPPDFCSRPYIYIELYGQPPVEHLH